MNRADLIEAFLEEFERLYAIYLQTEDLSALQEEYDQLLVNLSLIHIYQPFPKQACIHKIINEPIDSNPQDDIYNLGEHPCQKASLCSFFKGSDVYKRQMQG